jgi:hypothetical protein
MCARTDAFTDALAAEAAELRFDDLRERCPSCRSPYGYGWTQPFGPEGLVRVIVGGRCARPGVPADQPGGVGSSNEINSGPGAAAGVDALR